MLERLRNALQPLGCEICAVSAAHIPELKAEYETLRAAGELGDTSYHISQGLTKEIQDEAFALRTVLVVAAPSPIVRLVFHHEGRRRTVLIPPTYQDYVKRPPEFESILNAALDGTGFHVKYQGALPAKLLAVRSGLSQYGRNNIAYTGHMGSFAYLSTYVSDAPCEDGWRESSRMALCGDCVRCADNCPTGALCVGRRVIDVDRCITWHNERESAKPFPDWLEAGAHNSLVGCLRCQAVCPANREQMSRLDGPVEFDADETALLLGGAPLDTLPEALRHKLELTCINENYHVVARNLGVLLA